MPTHDIVDNRNEKLVDHINRILASTEAARFAVGYFFLSGLESIAERLKAVKELRLLIGNTTNRETLEQLAEGYQRLELVRDAAEAQAYPKRSEAKRMAEATAANIRCGVDMMDQTDESEALVKTLVHLIEEQRLKVRVYTKGRMHAKAYIFDYGNIFDAAGKPMERHEKGIAIVGSSNLTLSGVTHNTELNESHNFRHPNTQRYKLLQIFLHQDKRCCFLTATPRNKSAWDVYHQIKLFHQEDKTDLPVDPPDLKEYFKCIEEGEKQLPDLLYHLQIRRLRKHVLRWYGFAADTRQPLNEMSDEAVRPYLAESKRAYVIVAGKHQFFPKRELETIEYSIEETYQGLYQQLRGYLGKSRSRSSFENSYKESRDQPVKPSANELWYARYGLWHYVVKEKQRKEPYASLQRAGANLRGLMRVLLFKRFESSVHAFRETIRRLIRVHELFLAALQEGIVATGEAAQNILYEADEIWSSDLFAALQDISRDYLAGDFEIERLQNDIQHDIDLLEKILSLVEPITPQKDAKLRKLLECLKQSPLREGKRLIFTQYADTARYLFENLNPDGQREDIDVIYSSDKSKARVVGRFAPKANPEYQFQSGECELFTVIATDVLAEGLNLQDCDKIINYDLHWNPVRLIQRFGRIDRIGSDHDVIYGFNFLPETGINKHLGLKEELRKRIQEIHDTIGEDSAILDRTEQLNEEAMFAIYEKNGGQLNFFEEDDEKIVDLNEAEQILRQLRKENPGEYERIANLRDGIRTAKSSNHKGLYVFCQADNYQQLFLLNENGEVASRDIPRILATIRCAPDEKGHHLPRDYNASVMRVKRLFAEEVKHRQAEREHTLSLSQAQKYVLRELRVFFSVTEDEEVKAQINLLERAFRHPVTAAVKRELNLLRRNGMMGENLLKRLADIYYQHNLEKWLEHRTLQPEDRPIPKIICSEGLM